jgi:hypothetical protein
VPFVLASVLAPPAAFLLALGLAALFLVDGWGPRLGAFLFAAALAAAVMSPAAVALCRNGRDRRRVVEGRRIPVTVYFGRMTSEAFPVAHRRRGGRYVTSEGFPYLPVDAFSQPLLLLAAADGRRWLATPDQVSITDTRAPIYRANPWIAPMTVREPDGSAKVDAAQARDRPLPVDLAAPEHQAVREALGWMGQPEPHDPPGSRVDLARNDPRTFGGPVPGELLLAPEGRYQGLVLHRPADAPAAVPLEKGYGPIRYLYFGTDPGECCGLYLVSVKPVEEAPAASGPGQPPGR